jgi:hypothetical protein
MPIPMKIGGRLLRLRREIGRSSGGFSSGEEERVERGVGDLRGEAESGVQNGQEEVGEGRGDGSREEEEGSWRRTI